MILEAGNEDLRCSETLNESSNGERISKELLFFKSSQKIELSKFYENAL